MELRYMQDWTFFNNRIEYITRIEQASLNPPVRFYNYDGENVCLIEIGDGRGMLSIPTSVVARMDQAKEAVKNLNLDSLTNGDYLFDFYRGKFIDNSLGTAEWISFKDWSILPPNLGKTQYTNVFMKMADGKWTRGYGGTGTLMDSLFLLTELSYAPLDDKGIVDMDGFTVAVLMLVNRFGLKRPTNIEIEAVYKYCLPRGKRSAYHTDALVTFFHDQIPALIEAMDESNLGLEEDDDLDDAFFLQPKLDGMIDPPKVNDVRFDISYLIQNRRPPKVKRPTYANLDIKFEGIVNILILSHRRLRVVYNSHLISTEEVEEMFPSINHDNLELVDINIDKDKESKGDD